MGLMKKITLKKFLSRKMPVEKFERFAELTEIEFLTGSNKKEFEDTLYSLIDLRRDRINEGFVCLEVEKFFPSKEENLI